MSIDADFETLLSFTNPTCRQALEAAAAQAVKLGHAEVQVVHLLDQLLARPDTDLARVLTQCGVTRAELSAELALALKEEAPGTGRLPGFSPEIRALLQSAWLLTSLRLRSARIRSAGVVMALRLDPAFRDAFVQKLPALSQLDEGFLKDDLVDAVRHTGEARAELGEAMGPDVRRAVAGAERAEEKVAQLRALADRAEREAQAAEQAREAAEDRRARAEAKRAQVELAQGEAEQARALAEARLRAAQEAHRAADLLARHEERAASDAARAAQNQAQAAQEARAKAKQALAAAQAVEQEARRLEEKALKERRAAEALQAEEAARAQLARERARALEAEAQAAEALADAAEMRLSEARARLARAGEQADAVEVLAAQVEARPALPVLAPAGGWLSRVFRRLFRR